MFLPDCGHTIEVEGLDHWMDMKEEKEIQMKTCPRCRTIIRDCFRYGNVLKRCVKDVVLVKQKLMATRERQTDFALRLGPKLNTIIASIDRVFTTVKHAISGDLRFTMVNLQSMLTPRMVKGHPVYNGIDADQRFVVEVQLDVAERIVELAVKSSVSTQYPNYPMMPELLKEVLDKSWLVFGSLVQRQRLSKEDYDDFVQEMDRLSLIRAYFLL